VLLFTVLEEWVGEEVFLFSNAESEITHLETLHNFSSIPHLETLHNFSSIPTLNCRGIEIAGFRCSVD
jgi:hypothetical protein